MFYWQLARVKPKRKDNPPINASRKNGLCSPLLQAFSILHFVLLPIFNCNTFLCNAAILFGTLLFHFVTYQTAKPNTQAMHKKDSHSNHHHHSFIAVQKLSEAYLNIKCHYAIFWRSLSRMQGNQKIT